MDWPHGPRALFRERAVHNQEDQKSALNLFAESSLSCLLSKIRLSLLVVLVEGEEGVLTLFTLST